jgi:Subtilisin-like serine proteases
LQRSHGTTCAAIIAKYYPEAVFTSIKVLNDKNQKGKIEQFVKAIEWCLNEHIKIANLSLGTTNYKDFNIIKKIVNYAYKKGLIIVAACNNKNIFTYPASLTNVIGVKSNKSEILKEGEYIFNIYPLDGIEITSSSDHILKESTGEERTTYECNSFAAPFITAKVCRIVDK